MYKLALRVMYQVGFTPWEGHGYSAPLRELLSETTPGMALDLGCGSGGHALLMAEAGWRVTAVDAVPKALRLARRRASAAGEAGRRIRFVRGDVTRLGRDLTSEVFDLVTDIGCLHGLTDDLRGACLAGLEPFTRPGTRLLMLSVLPRRAKFGPTGMSEEDVRRYAGELWTLEDTVDDDTPPPNASLDEMPFRWYSLRRK